MKPVEHADYERFVAFTFAAADLAVEIDPDHRITYAAGGFPARFGREAEAFIGQPFRTLVLPVDGDPLRMALATLTASGRLAPCVVRLANESRKPMSLTGLSLSSTGRPTRLHLCFSSLPEVQDCTTITAAALFRGAECAVRESGGQLDLIEIAADGAAPVASSAIAAAIRAIAPDTMVAELAGGRFAILRAGAESVGEDTVDGMREKLRAAGVKATLLSNQLDLQGDGLTAMQAVRALRHALAAFTRDGMSGLRASHCADGLAGYLRRSGEILGPLRQIIRDEAFELAYQPIVSMGERDVRRFEALIRPTRALAGVKTPQEFVMMAEALGLAEQLDLAVMRKVCDAASQSGQSIALNLSSQSVQSESFRRRLTGDLRRHQAAGCRISVELTETAEIDDLQAVAETAHRLHELGVSVALDDFGTGTAGVAVLRAIKPDVVKLDGSFTVGIAESGRARALLEGLVGVARSAANRIVAERIETEGEAEVLSAYVDEGQGWLFGRPNPLPSSPRGKSPAATKRTSIREGWR